ncbi:MAG: diacylglycerol kinase family lipid kinase [Deltaproteobacteria bacterium]|nr:diacylglycerol kinase family lipid kinase [Deltaproteobacteria bacterium]
MPYTTFTMSDMLSIRFIVNPIAGGRDRTAEITEAVKDVFADANGLFEIKVTRSKNDGARLSSSAAKKGFQTVFACGGDGTINEVAGALVNTDTVLGIVPLGSGNGFSRSLGIPQNISHALGLALKGRETRIDVGVAAERFFFATAGIGFDALLSERYALRFEQKKKRGILPYFLIGLREFFKYMPQTTIFRTPEAAFKTTPFLAVFANTMQYGGGAKIAPRACPSDGVIDMCIVHSKNGLPSRLKILRLLPRLFTGRLADTDIYRHIQTTGPIEVEMEKAGSIHVDGEPFLAPASFRVELLRGALKVWAKG